jgi:hypothetical protein
MFCTNCGTPNPDNAAVCGKCGQMLRPAGMPPLPPAYQRVPTYLAHSILATLLCCLPGGIVAIVYAAQVDSRARMGDIAGAMDASSKAKTWCWVSFGVGLLFIIGYGALMAIGVLGGASRGRF